uniref:Uncharacterized protein n=1 Tax=Rhizophora mucronata TaxID=61149 RepID=A0A2P2QA61_RHIMU
MGPICQNSRRKESILEHSMKKEIKIISKKKKKNKGKTSALLCFALAFLE